MQLSESWLKINIGSFDYEFEFLLPIKVKIILQLSYFHATFRGVFQRFCDRLHGIMTWHSSCTRIRGSLATCSCSYHQLCDLLSCIFMFAHGRVLRGVFHMLGPTFGGIFSTIWVLYSSVMSWTWVWIIMHSFFHEFEPSFQGFLLLLVGYFGDINFYTEFHF